MNNFNVGDTVFFIQNTNSIRTGIIKKFSKINPDFGYYQILMENPIKQIVTIPSSYVFSQEKYAFKFLKERNNEYIKFNCKNIKTYSDLMNYCLNLLTNNKVSNVELQIIKQKRQEFNI